MWSKPLKLLAVSAMISSIVVHIMLTYCPLLRSVYDFKAGIMNMQLSLHRKFCKFLQVHTATESTKNICCKKDEGAIDHCTIIWLFKIFYSGCKNVNDQVISERPNYFLGTVHSSKTTREYQTSSVSHNWGSFFTFPTPAKVSGAVEVYLTWAKYWNLF